MADNLHAFELTHVYKEANGDEVVALVTNHIGTILGDFVFIAPTKLLDLLYSNSHRCIYTRIV